MRVVRQEGVWQIIEQRGRIEERWRIESVGRVVLRRAGAREEHPVAAAAVPLDVAVALLAMRDAAEFVAAHPGERICGPAALARWPIASRDPLLRGRIEPGARIAGWRTFRATFEAVVAAATASRSPAPG